MAKNGEKCDSSFIFDRNETERSTMHLRSMLTPLIVFLKIGFPKLTTPVEMVKAFAESDAAAFDDVNCSSFLDEE